MKKVKVKRHKRKDGSTVEAHDRSITARPTLKQKLKVEVEDKRKSSLLQSFFGDDNDTT